MRVNLGTYNVYAYRNIRKIMSRITRKEHISNKQRHYYSQTFKTRLPATSRKTDQLCAIRLHKRNFRKLCVCVA